jgi:radical SAM enzyme (TIGR01210 family)
VNLEVNQHIQALLRRYMEKKRTELPLFNHDPGKGFSTFTEDGVPRPHLTIVLRTPGCSWLRKTGGCTMCGFAIDSLYPVPAVSAQNIITQYKGEMSKYSWLECPLTVSIFNNGSFFDPEEIPPPAQTYILEQLGKDPRVREVRIETRPEFVESSLIEDSSAWFTDTELHISIGLEVCSDKIRSLSIHKGFTYNDFVRAAEKIRQYAHLDVYLLLKPPFLTEGEAVEEMKESLRTLAAVFASTVYITPCKVFPTTLLKDLQDRGLYRIPWLWSLLEIAQFFSEFSPPFRLFLVPGDPVEEEPCGGAVGAGNCGECDQGVKDIIDYFNRNQKIPGTVPTCWCRDQWEEQCSQPAPPLRERVLDFLEEVVQ